MKIFHTLLFFVVFLLLNNPIFSQKIEKICGEYTYTIPDNITLEQAKSIAIEQAKINALVNKYGTIVSQTNTIFIQGNNETFSSLGGTEVKGEWLENTKEPEIIRSDMDKITAKVCGKAREITSAIINFSAKILNHLTAKQETNIFQNNERFFLSFRSPVDGYLAVYLLDDEETVFCLLPYMNNPAGKEKIKAGKDYLFFSQEHVPPAERAMVDEYEMTCKKSVEQNFFYLIFSPNEFIKANDTRELNEKNLPRELPAKEFQSWLMKSRQRDKDMKVEIKSVTIKK